MKIQLHGVRPFFMSISEIENSEIYGNKKLVFTTPNSYLVKASSGRGKTSLFNIIYGILDAFVGELIISENIEKNEPWKTKLSCVFQDLKLFPELTALENIQLKNILTGHKTSNQIDDYFKKLNLDGRQDQLLSEMSFGQKQRVAIIRALVQPFEFILLDEPFSHLDDNNIIQAVELLKTECSENNAGLILMSLEDNNFFNYHQKLNL